MDRPQVFTIAFLLIFVISNVWTARPLTPYQRTFTPIRNISCSQCHMEFEPPAGGYNFVELEMKRRECLDEPQKFFRPCPKDEEVAPRGCGKITTYAKSHIGHGRTHEVTMVRRFCASEGAEPEEIQCQFSASPGGYMESCICGHDNCNFANPLAKCTSALMLTVAMSICSVL
ncbi:unnamed protein product [Dicrocoelium dendriticum]|nr:unnamed protein product [Dicrocoelium dendriticum]